MNEGTLGNWVHKYRLDHAGEEPPLSISDRARLRELERENRELKMKAEFLGKAAAGSTGQRNSDCQLISGGEVFERLAGSGVELQRDRIELCLCVARQVGPFREILAQ